MVRRALSVGMPTGLRGVQGAGLGCVAYTLAARPLSSVDTWNLAEPISRRTVGIVPVDAFHFSGHSKVNSPHLPIAFAFRQRDAKCHRRSGGASCV